MARPSREEMLENVEKAINALTSNGAVQSYSIGGRDVKKMELEELKAWRETLLREMSSAADRTTYAHLGDPQ